jgi:hypothetical protein
VLYGFAGREFLQGFALRDGSSYAKKGGSRIIFSKLLITSTLSALSVYFETLVLSLSV